MRWHLDSDPGGLKGAKMKGKTKPKDRYLDIKSLKSNETAIIFFY
jgi:hypothetical protein